MSTEHDLNSLKRLVHEVLSGDITDLQVQHMRLEEQPEENRCRVEIDLNPTGGEAPMSIQGTGVGVVDATFNAAKSAFAKTYPSLRHLVVDDFRVLADMTTGRVSMGSDVMGTVRLVIRNDKGRRFEFEDKSRSMTGSSIRVVLRAVSHFINAERAVRIMSGAIENARVRNRGELVETYSLMLSELVKHASYVEVIQSRQMVTQKG
ncbi:MAG: hypothetical protein CMH54_15640 [Myxococcales bacterium]|nr:hypothetical protein [Myxococcales bacterium]